MLLVGLVRLQQQGREGRRERKRDDQRDHRGGRDRHGELAIEDSRNAGDEGGRHEHRHEDEADGDQRAGHLTHRVVRGVARRQAVADMALHRLDDDDGVVDDDADREHQREERQRVDREAECQLDREGADQADRNGDDRNDRGAPRLEEDEDDDDDQDDRLDQCVLHRLDRGLDIFGRVVGDRIMEARREIARGGLDLGEHPLGGVQRVRAGLLDDRERDAAASAEIAANAVILAAELDPADVADAGDRARHRIGLDDDIGELGRIGEPALNLDRKLEGRAAAVERRLADGAAGDLYVLRPKRVDDLVGGEVPGGRAIGIDPHAHRIIAAAEHGDSADALKPEQPVAKARIGVIADIVDIERRIGRGERDDHQEALRLLGDDDADLADLIG